MNKKSSVSAISDFIDIDIDGLDPFEHCGTQGREVPLEVRQGRQLPFMLTAEMAMG